MTPNVRSNLNYCILSLQGRDLTGANLEATDVRHVDFSGAILRHANLSRAWAENAHFDNAQLQDTSFGGTQLQGASLKGAQLRDAYFSKANLHGADLDRAQLQDAALEDAQLQGASLKYALLQGAWLLGAQAQGASFHEANLQGASLNFAQLQGASLGFARLQGASFDHAQLQAAFLDQAHLQGASFNEAKLQGAFLSGANLQGVSFRQVFVWRADTRTAGWKDTRVADPNTAKKESCWINYEPAVCDWTANSFDKLINMISVQVPEGENRQLAMERIKTALDPKKALEGEKEMARVWADRQRSSPAPEVYETSLAETGCAADGAPYVLQALLRRLDDPDASLFAAGSPEVPKLAAAFLDKDCAGARGLFQHETAKLKDIAASAPSQAPKQ